MDIRITSPALESILGKEIAIPNLGFVIPVDYMGSDKLIVNAARVSYKGGRKSQSDENLIRYLLRHKHTGPFEFPVITLYIKAPLFVAKQWHRHRTASINEISGRYVELPEEWYVPKSITQHPINSKQGRSEELVEEQESCKKMMCEAMENSRKAYKVLVEHNTAKEIARTVLPSATYTEWYWKIDLHNLLHFLQLRLCYTAQYEIREYAKAILQVVEKWVPVTYRAFIDYKLNSVTLPRHWLERIHRRINGSAEDDIEMSKGEEREFEKMYADAFGFLDKKTEF